MLLVCFSYSPTTEGIQVEDMRTEDVINFCMYKYSSSWAAHAMQFAETLGDYSRVTR